MRDYKHIDQYINKLYGDIYPQPEDVGHTKLAQKVIDRWMSRMTSCKSVLDVGCGTGFCQPMFEKWNKRYEGVCLGEDFTVATEKGHNVKLMDFSFLEYEDNSFDLIFSRHSLEHSPMPLLTLMEWHRVAKNWCGLVLPAPEWYTYKGLNHYAVMNLEQVSILAEAADWNILWQDVDIRQWNEDTGEMRPHEYWFMLEKKR